MEETLERLEARETEAERRVHELDLEQARASRITRELEGAERALEEAEKEHDAKARDQARKLLMEARQEVEEAVSDLRKAAEGGGGLDEAVHRARSRVEQAAERTRVEEPGRGDDRSTRAPRPPAGLAPGDRVRLRATGAKGRVAEIREDRVMVEAGSIRLEVPLTELEPIDGGAGAAGSPSATANASAGASAGGRGWTGPDREGGRIEVDLRGLRVDELEVQLGARARRGRARRTSPSCASSTERGPARCGNAWASCSAPTRRVHDVPDGRTDRGWRRRDRRELPGAVMIPDDLVEEVRTRADIVDVIGEFVQLKKAGREYKANCPFHEERTPSFYVVPDKGFYKCFGCGKSGDVFSFLMEKQGMDFVEAVRHVAGRSGVEIREVQPGPRRGRPEPPLLRDQRLRA